jgi:hypothetical protein
MPRETSFATIYARFPYRLPPKSPTVPTAEYSEYSRFAVLLSVSVREIDPTLTSLNYVPICGYKIQPAELMRDAGRIAQ